MNYLAHLYLSGPIPGVRVGNFIGDYVKGTDFTRYAPVIRQGILLHRKIDDFTDRHPVFRASTRYFQPMYRRYAGVVTDIAYDHFLAANWGDFSDQSLSRFVSESHRILMGHYFSLPGGVKQFLPFLIKSRRMETYQTLEGVEKTLRIMAGYSSLPNHPGWAIEQIQTHYQPLSEAFYSFFGDVRDMCRVHLETEMFRDTQAIQP